MYRGKLIEAEDNMNSQMASVTVTYRDGRVPQLENIYIRSDYRISLLPTKPTKFTSGVPRFAS